VGGRSRCAWHSEWEPESTDLEESCLPRWWRSSWPLRALPASRRRWSNATGEVDEDNVELRRDAGKDALTTVPPVARTAEDAANSCTGPPGRKTHHGEVGEDVQRPRVRKELAAGAEPRRTRSRRRAWGGGRSTGVGLRRGGSSPWGRSTRHMCRAQGGGGSC
jgi:hypothetical protein